MFWLNIPDFVCKNMTAQFPAVEMPGLGRRKNSWKICKASLKIPAFVSRNTTGKSPFVPLKTAGFTWQKNFFKLSWQSLKLPSWNCQPRFGLKHWSVVWQPSHHHSPVNLSSENSAHRSADIASQLHPIDMNCWNIVLLVKCTNCNCDLH